MLAVVCLFARWFVGQRLQWCFSLLFLFIILNISITLLVGGLNPCCVFPSDMVT